VLKEQGYVTGQFGKNHLGDRNEHLPTVHGFDEFFGNLYHLNTQEEFEQKDYPQDPEYFKDTEHVAYCTPGQPTKMIQRLTQGLGRWENKKLRIPDSFQEKEWKP